MQKQSKEELAKCKIFFVVSCWSTDESFIKARSGFISSPVLNLLKPFPEVQFSQMCLSRHATFNCATRENTGQFSSPHHFSSSPLQQEDTVCAVSMLQGLFFPLCLELLVLLALIHGQSWTESHNGSTEANRQLSGSSWWSPPQSRKPQWQRIRNNSERSA